MQILLQFFLKHQKTVFLLLTVLAGLLIFAGRMDHQPYVSQGDHGRDLYAFKRILDGAIPYKDFSWLFGPAMAYYYAAFFKVFGVSIQSALLGQNILLILTGVIFYLICVTFLPAALSFVCALWYWAFRGGEFFYTYNHTGGVVCMLLMVLALVRYLSDGRVRHVIAGLVAAFVFMMIRPTMACAVLTAWTGSLILIEAVKRPVLWKRNIRIHFYGAMACGLAALLVYWLYFKDLPVYVLWESFPISKAQRTDGTENMWVALQDLWKYVSPIFLSSAAGKTLGVLLAVLAAGAGVFLFRRDEASRPARRTAALVLISLAGLMAVTFHEYLFSGIYYRIFWVFPALVLFMFFMIGYALAGQRKIIQALVIGALFCMTATTLYQSGRVIASSKTPGQMLQVGKTRVYTFQASDWFATVQGVCDFVNKNVPPGEKVLTLPFDTLYNFLTGRDQPTRQWVFFQHFIIPREQEETVIEDIEREKVNWVIFSNRAISLEPGLGLFGRDYCQLLWKYLDQNYTPVAAVGPWTSRGSWAWEHGVVIFHRKAPFSAGVGHDAP